jgi:class 3 adenylate cyclase
VQQKRQGEQVLYQCGVPLTETPATSKYPSPDAYTSKQLAGKILTSKAAREGERKQVTILFAGMKGSMKCLADRDPEEARKLPDPVLEHMMEAAHCDGHRQPRHGRWDMALFGPAGPAQVQAIPGGGEHRSHTERRRATRRPMGSANGSTNSARPS